MKKLLILALPIMAVFGLSARPSKTTTKRPVCGGWISFVTLTSDPITQIKIDGGGMNPITINNPSLPFTQDIGTLSPIITIAFASGSGTQLFTRDYDGSVIDCETYAAPHGAPVGGEIFCEGYHLTISHNPCP